MMDNKQAQAVTFEESGHVPFKCQCERMSCQFCAGGLFACAVCDSFEGATTTHCPDEPMDRDKAEAVYAGKVDFRDGEWVEAGSPHTPNRGWDLYRLESAE